MLKHVETLPYALLTSELDEGDGLVSRNDRNPDEKPPGTHCMED
jgi:hypothetical protein